MTGDASGILNLNSNGTTVAAVSSTGMAVTGTLSSSGASTLTGAITATAGINTPNTFGFKNRIINGGMVIDQRNAGASVTPTTGAYTIDRWFHQLSQASKISVQRSTTAPTGFINSAIITSLTAYSVGVNDYFNIVQAAEGLNVSDLGWGTANAQTITVSFWVRSSLTGTFGGAVLNSTQARSYPFTYTISAANTFEQKTVTIVGDTSGTWLTDNGAGLRLSFGLGVGSNFSSASGAWASGTYLSATGATSVVGTSGATFYITGVQLEKGSTATSFDFRAYSTELAMCQRYYEKSYNIDVAVGSAITAGQVSYMSTISATSQLWGGSIFFKVTKRATPTVAGWSYQGNSGQWHYGSAGSSEALGTIVFYAPSMSVVTPYMTGIPAGQNTAYGHYTASAEL
jgi:hypothetical protein